MQKPGAALSLIFHWCRYAGESRSKSRIILDSSGCHHTTRRPDRQRSMMCVRRICSKSRIRHSKWRSASHTVRAGAVSVLYSRNVRNGGLKPFVVDQELRAIGTFSSKSQMDEPLDL